MSWAVKLKVTTSDCEKIYEIGENKVVSIHINSEEEIIEITKDVSDFNIIIIPFNTLIYFKYKSEKPEGTAMGVTNL
ncbi:hypothetical protein [Methanobacterium spitsbergense]|uniref:Uncharacterized protein n=1 Tax=Methanobacterium spitsbergense TaxID=2874285 RepID=A0A8T5UWB0_9EURY|nr:hypothetical protein [Methanobacterium spitsbergense]MBZ2166186.1 hypothetical protein [Methanobacterium spitsbergense]